MVELPRKRVFISYARKDAVRLATELQQNLQPAHDVWLDTRRIAGGASWTVEIEKAIDDCDVLLALLTSGSYISDICRAEQLRALRRGKQVIPLLAETNADRPLHLETKNFRDFTAHPPSHEQLRQLRDDIRTGRDRAVLPEKFRKTYVTAPPLPRNYIERPEALASLRSSVILDEPGPSIALTALRGMGGIGKTVLAQALSHDEVVHQAFPDGIAWTTVGKDVGHNLKERMQRVRRALGDEPDPSETEEQCIDLYRTLLREKHALVIVDDIWRTADIEPFLAESRRSRLLFTTRDGAIAAATGAAEHLADLLTSEQAFTLLARWAGCPPEALPAEAADLVRECGRLPLALSMIGAMLRGKPPAYWDHVLGLLRRADLVKIRAQFPFYPHADMLRAIQVSVDALPANARRSYIALAVLVDDMSAPPAVQQTLWNVGASEALETAEQFINVSLAQRDANGCGIRLHDLQLDWVRAEHPERAALELIHGAVRLSSHVIERDPGQFASQMVGRLLPFCDTPAIRRFTEEIAAAAPRPWIRPLHPALHPTGTELVLTLEGHSRYVSGVAVTPDGKRAVSASDDHTLKVWDLDTGRALRTLQGHSAEVVCVAVMPDGKRVVSGSEDNTLKVWDLETGRALRTLVGHSHWVSGVAVTPDGKRAVSASWDRTLKVWDLDTGRALRTLEGHSWAVNKAAVTPDGKRAISASNDKTLKVWDLETGRALRTLEGHSDEVLGVAVTPDGKRAVSASKDDTLKVWDVETGRALRTLQAHPDAFFHFDAVLGVAVTPDGKQAVSASNDKTLKVWDLDTGRPLRTLQGHSDLVYGVAVTPDGKRAVSASGDHTLKVWDIAGSVSRSETDRALRTLEGHSNAVSGVAVAQNGKRAVSASGDQTLKVWDMESGRELRTLKGLSHAINGVAVTPDGNWAVSASRDRTLKVWDLETGRALRTLEGHSDGVQGVALTPDGKRVVSASWDRTLKVWDLETGRALRTLEGHSDLVYGVAVTPDGKRAVSASGDHTLKVWELDTGRALLTLKAHSREVLGVAVTPDGKRAVSASKDNTLKVWNLDTGLPVTSFWCDTPALCCAVAGNRDIVAGDAGGRVYFLRFEDRS